MISGLFANETRITIVLAIVSDGKGGTTRHARTGKIIEYDENQQFILFQSEGNSQRRFVIPLSSIIELEILANQESQSSAFFT
jgi:hypothetical protein